MQDAITAYQARGMWHGAGIARTLKLRPRAPEPQSRGLGRSCVCGGLVESMVSLDRVLEGEEASTVFSKPPCRGHEPARAQRML